MFFLIFASVNLQLILNYSFYGKEIERHLRSSLERTHDGHTRRLCLL